MVVAEQWTVPLHDQLCKAQFELTLFLGWRGGVPAQCWDGSNRVWVCLGSSVPSSTPELAGGPAQILKTLKCPSWSVNIISCQPTTGFPVHRTELWLVSTSAQKKRKKRGEQLLPHFISEIFVHHILAKMTFYMEEQSNNHKCLYEYLLSARHITKYFPFIALVNPTTTQWGKCYHESHISDKETDSEIVRISLRSHIN